MNKRRLTWIMSYTVILMSFQTISSINYGQLQSLYTPSPRCLIATPYSTSVSVPLYAITNQRALALASRFSRMLSFQIKDMEFPEQTAQLPLIVL